MMKIKKLIKNQAHYWLYKTRETIMKNCSIILRLHHPTAAVRKEQDSTDRRCVTQKLQHIMIVLCLIFLVSTPLTGEMLIEIGNEDETSLNMIKGEWQILENGCIFNFTDKLARKLYGLKYYYYHTSINSGNKIYLFTIVKSKKTGRLYFARGEWRKGQFLSSTSRIRFRGKNHMIVYSRDNHKDILFEAVRIVRTKIVTSNQ